MLACSSGVSGTSSSDSSSAGSPSGSEPSGSRCAARWPWERIASTSAIAEATARRSSSSAGAGAVGGAGDTSSAGLEALRYRRGRDGGRGAVPIPGRAPRDETREPGQRGEERVVGVLEQRPPGRVDRLRVLEVLLEERDRRSRRSGRTADRRRPRSWFYQPDVRRAGCPSRSRRASRRRTRARRRRRQLAASVRCDSVIRAATSATRMAAGARRPGLRTTAIPESASENAQRYPAIVSAPLLRNRAQAAPSRGRAAPVGRSGRNGRVGRNGRLPALRGGADRASRTAQSGTNAMARRNRPPGVGSARIAHQTTALEVDDRDLEHDQHEQGLPRRRPSPSPECTPCLSRGRVGS